MAHFVSNVVAMATRVSRGSIFVTLFNSPTPKPVLDAQIS